MPHWYSDVDAMLAAEKIDLIDIVTRMDTHRALVEKTIATWHRDHRAEAFRTDLGRRRGDDTRRRRRRACSSRSMRISASRRRS